jgi:DNA-binding GntR family transcriptional regulator
MQADRSGPTRLSIQEAVVGGLREKIISGELKSGASLSEVLVAEEYGVSRTPVREALKQLQTEGLLEIRPKVGTFVKAPSRVDVFELFQLKEILEGAAASLLANRGESVELRELRANVERSQAAVRGGDVEQYATLVEEFHSLIVTGAGNSALIRQYRLLMNQLAYPRLVQTSVSLPGRLERSDDEHHRVLDIITAKDGATAERLMRDHVRASREALLAQMVFPDERG